MPLAVERSRIAASLRQRAKTEAPYRASVMEEEAERIERGE